MDATDPRAVLERLIQERREDYAGLSRLLGRNETYIQQYIKRGSPRRLADPDRRKLARYFGIDEQLLGAPAGEPDPETGLVDVPRLEVEAAAGAGALPAAGERTLGRMAFDARWLRKHGALDRAAVSIIRVHGDSMAPTLSDGDEILVNRADAAGRLRDGIYVLRADDALLVKRVAIEPGGRTVAIRSDNEAYPPWRGDRGRIDVVGRVIWVGRALP